MNYKNKGIDIKQQVFPYLVAFYNSFDQFVGCGCIVNGPQNIPFLISCLHVIQYKKLLKCFWNFKKEGDLDQKLAKYYYEIHEKDIRSVKSQDIFYHQIDPKKIIINEQPAAAPAAEDDQNLKNNQNQEQEDSSPQQKEIWKHLLGALEICNTFEKEKELMIGDEVAITGIVCTKKEYLFAQFPRVSFYSSEASLGKFVGILPQGSSGSVVLKQTIDNEERIQNQERKFNKIAKFKIFGICVGTEKGNSLSLLNPRIYQILDEGFKPFLKKFEETIMNDSSGENIITFLDLQSTLITIYFYLEMKKKFQC